ncbi:MAG: low molecular weight protein-tyrosine-phosphatase [Planctomycetota bacterium]
MASRILFVCMGNICRSPAAEAVMKAIVDPDDFVVESAGTHDYHVGDPPDPRMAAACQGRGIEMTSRGRHVDRSDLTPGVYDRVVAMDRGNLSALRGMFGGELPEHVALFSQFLDGDWPDEVPDPYYGNADGFELVLDMLQAGCPTLLDDVLQRKADD